MILALLVVLSIAGAAKEDKSHHAMDANYKVVSCRIDSTNTMIDDFVAKVPQASGLADQKTKLNADKTQLGTLHDSGDRSAYNSYSTGTYLPDQKTANKALEDARKHLKLWNVSQEVITELKQTADDQKKAFADCKTGAVGDFGNAKIAGYKNLISEMENEMNTLKQKHPDVDTTRMQQVLTSAGSFVDELEQKFNAATTGEEKQKTLRGYCLFNGCGGGQNFHLAGKFTSARLEAILNALPNTPEEKATAQGYVDAANQALTGVGTSEYTPETREAVWGNLQNAAKEIKSLINGEEKKNEST